LPSTRFRLPIRPLAAFCFHFLSLLCLFPFGAEEFSCVDALRRRNERAACRFRRRISSNKAIKLCHHPTQMQRQY
jgi:hypothetical protein